MTFNAIGNLDLTELTRRAIDFAKHGTFTDAAVDANQAVRQKRDEAARRERQELLASVPTIPSAREARTIGMAYRYEDDELAIAFLERALEGHLARLTNGT